MFYFYYFSRIERILISKQFVHSNITMRQKCRNNSEQFMYIPQTLANSRISARLNYNGFFKKNLPLQVSI